MQVRAELGIYNIDSILPPWIAFPGVAKEDLFWLMGIGENYINNFHKSLINSETNKYFTEFEVPKQWEGFFLSQLT